MGQDDATGEQLRFRLQIGKERNVAIVTVVRSSRLVRVMNMRMVMSGLLAVNRVDNCSTEIILMNMIGTA